MDTKRGTPRPGTVRIVYDPEAPSSEKQRWRPVTSLIRKVCAEQGIRLGRVHLHYHPDGAHTLPDSHPHGEAEYWGKTIFLCTADKDTALHEIAHVWTKSWHSPKWAEAYLYLCEQYMRHEEFIENIKKNASKYAVVRHALKRIYGIVIKDDSKGTQRASAQQRAAGRVRS